jgi:hypothetical protein
MKEIWKDIKGYEGLYQVSNLGRVKSLARRVNSMSDKGRFVRERILKQVVTEAGYARVCLCKENIEKTVSVHRLVAIMFLKNPENKPEVNHKDGVKLNNYIDNLEWCTNSENGKHAYRIGLKKPSRGVLSGSNKLSEQNVIDIRTTLSHISTRKLADKFGVHFMTISDIRLRKIWKHLP